MTTRTIDFVWEVKGPDGQIIIQQELEVVIGLQRDSDGFTFDVEQIGFDGAWLEKDGPEFRLIEKAVRNSRSFEDEVAESCWG